MKKYLTPEIQWTYFEEEIVRTSEIGEGVFEQTQDDPWFFG